MKYAELDPCNPESWGPSVRFERLWLTPQSRPGNVLVADCPIGKNGIVTAVKFVNVGTNSSVEIGRGDFAEVIPRTGAAEISFGAGFPFYIQDDFRINWTATGASPVHKVLVITTVVNFK